MWYCYRRYTITLFKMLSDNHLWKIYCKQLPRSLNLSMLSKNQCLYSQTFVCCVAKLVIIPSFIHVYSPLIGCNSPKHFIDPKICCNDLQSYRIIFIKGFWLDLSKWCKCQGHMSGNVDRLWTCRRCTSDQLKNRAIDCDLRL